MKHNKCVIHMEFCIGALLIVCYDYCTNTSTVSYRWHFIMQYNSHMNQTHTPSTEPSSVILAKYRGAWNLIVIEFSFRWRLTLFLRRMVAVARYRMICLVLIVFSLWIPLKRNAFLQNGQFWNEYFSIIDNDNSAKWARWLICYY